MLTLGYGSKASICDANLDKKSEWCPTLAPMSIKMALGVSVFKAFKVSLKKKRSGFSKAP